MPVARTVNKQALNIQAWAAPLCVATGVRSYEDPRSRRLQSEELDPV